MNLDLTVFFYFSLLHTTFVFQSEELFSVMCQLKFCFQSKTLSKFMIFSYIQHMFELLHTPDLLKLLSLMFSPIYVSSIF